MATSALSARQHSFRCDQNGPPAALLVGYVSIKICALLAPCRRPILIATLRAVAIWLIFRVAHSLRINSDMLVVRALKISQMTGGESYVISRTGH
jgi:hypothetical protein